MQLLSLPGLSLGDPRVAFGRKCSLGMVKWQSPWTTAAFRQQCRSIRNEAWRCSPASFAVLELALPVKVLALQQLQAQGRNIRAHQREEPDDLHLAREELLGLLGQIQPEPYKFYERWEVLLITDRGTRRTGALIHDLWRHLPEQIRLRPEGSGELRRFTGLLQESRGLCIKLQQDRHHASHSKADTAFHSLSWHAAVLRLAEMPAELLGITSTDSCYFKGFGDLLIGF